MTKDEALKLALETLENSRVFVMSREMIKQPEGADWYDTRITAIKEALAQPEREPVAREQFHEHMAGSFYKPPPQRPWVGLTETDILAASRHWRHAEDFMAGVYWAAGTLKEKNA